MKKFICPYCDKEIQEGTSCCGEVHGEWREAEVDEEVRDFNFIENAFHMMAARFYKCELCGKSVKNWPPKCIECYEDERRLNKENLCQKS